MGKKEQIVPLLPSMDFAALDSGIASPKKPDLTVGMLTPENDYMAFLVATGMQQNEAYRHSHKNVKTKNKATVDVNASKIAGTTKFKLRVQHFRRLATSKWVIQLEDVLHNLSESAMMPLYNESGTRILTSAEHSNRIKANELLYKHYAGDKEADKTFNGVLRIRWEDAPAASGAASEGPRGEVKPDDK